MDQLTAAGDFLRVLRPAEGDVAFGLPATIELVAAGASAGDIIERLKTLWGTYRETPVF